MFFFSLYFFFWVINEAKFRGNSFAKVLNRFALSGLKKNFYIYIYIMYLKSDYEEI